METFTDTQTNLKRCFWNWVTQKVTEHTRIQIEKFCLLATTLIGVQKIRETLQIVYAMVDSNNAIVLMRKHEYNALCFHFQETEGAS